MSRPRSDRFVRQAGWADMDIRKSYYVWRIGRSSDKVTKGEVYITSVSAGFDGNRRWMIKATDKKGQVFHPTLTKGSKMWIVMASV
jgi:hypothetical protein